MHPYISAHRAELDYWPGVSHRYQMRGKHQAIVLTFNGSSQFVMFPKTPSDSMRGLHNHLRDLRQTLKALGAERGKVSRKAKQLSAKHHLEPEGTIVLPPRAHGRSPENDPWHVLALRQAANENVMAHPGRTVAEDTRPWDWPAQPVDPVKQPTYEMALSIFFICALVVVAGALAWMAVQQ